MNRVITLIIVSMVIFPQAVAFAEEFSVTASKAVYTYGDYLSFTVNVPKITDDRITVKIIDDSGMPSSPIEMKITEKSKMFTAPNPFESSVFGEGTYTLQVEYEKNITATEFALIDSGAIVIPFWIKDVAGLWIEQVIDDKFFLKSLVDNQIIMIDEKEEDTIKESTTVSIPAWYKTNAVWWRNGIISDDEFAKGLQYLVTVNVITVDER